MVVFIAVNVCIIIIVMMFTIAWQHDVVDELKRALKNAIQHADNIEKELNRHKICARMDKELYGADVDAMRKQIKAFERHVDRLEFALMAKNQEIIRLKTRGVEK